MEHLRYFLNKSDKKDPSFLSFKKEWKKLRMEYLFNVKYPTESLRHFVTELYDFLLDELFFEFHHSEGFYSASNASVFVVYSLYVVVTQQPTFESRSKITYIPMPQYMWPALKAVCDYAVLLSSRTLDPLKILRYLFRNDCFIFSSARSVRFTNSKIDPYDSGRSGHVLFGANERVNLLPNPTDDLFVRLSSLSVHCAQYKQSMAMLGPEYAVANERPFLHSVNDPLSLSSHSSSAVVQSSNSMMFGDDADPSSSLLSKSRIKSEKSEDHPDYHSGFSSIDNDALMQRLKSMRASYAAGVSDFLKQSGLHRHSTVVFPLMERPRNKSDELSETQRSDYLRACDAYEKESHHTFKIPVVSTDLPPPPLLPYFDRPPPLEDFAVSDSGLSSSLIKVEMGDDDSISLFAKDHCNNQTNMNQQHKNDDNNNTMMDSRMDSRMDGLEELDPDSSDDEHLISDIADDAHSESFSLSVSKKKKNSEESSGVTERMSDLSLMKDGGIVAIPEAADREAELKSQLTQDMSGINDSINELKRTDRSRALLMSLPPDPSHIKEVESKKRQFERTQKIRIKAKVRREAKQGLVTEIPPKKKVSPNSSSTSQSQSQSQSK